MCRRLEETEGSTGESDSCALTTSGHLTTPDIMKALVILIFDRTFRVNSMLFLLYVNLSTISTIPWTRDDCEGSLTLGSVLHARRAEPNYPDELHERHLSSKMLLQLGMTFT